MKKIILLIVLFTLSYATLKSQSVLIENVNILDVKTGTITTKQSVFIEGEKIATISSKKIRPKENTQILDGTSKFLIPGMIDSHIHFFQSGGLYTRPDIIDLRKVVSYENEIQFTKDIIPDSFKRYLMLGITSVIDAGGPFYNFTIRDSITKNHLSPNVYVTGPLFSPYQPKAFSELKDTPIEKITSIEEATALFDKMLPNQPDFIKIWYIVNKDNPAEKNFPIVKHIAKLARENNLKLAVHATQLKTASLAIEAGANILVHSIKDEVLDDRFIKLLKDKEVTYIPTLNVSNNYTKTFFSELDMHPQDIRYANPKAYASLLDLINMKQDLIPERFQKIRNDKQVQDAIKNRFAKEDSVIAINLKKLQNNKINIATGTDAGNIGTMHASSYIQEIEKMQEVGISNLDIIKASTINPAKGFGLDHKIGSIEEEKLADLVLLNKNPIEDIQNLTSIHKVIKSGKILAPLELIKETPEQIVQRQVNAYNARDIDAFLDTYADAIEIYRFPNTSYMIGKQAMRKRYEPMFENFENLYCDIKNRIVLHNKVIDREYVRRGDSHAEVIAIYEITDNKISKVTFLK